MKTPEKSTFKIRIDSTDRYKKSVKLVRIHKGEEKEVSEREGDIDIVAEIAGILGEQKLKAKDITEYESNPGPGSFTGLKIGTTIANVFNWALGKKKINELALPEYGREPNITPRKK